MTAHNSTRHLLYISFHERKVLRQPFPLKLWGGKQHRVKSHHELMPGSTWKALRSGPAALQTRWNEEVRKQVYVHHYNMIAAGNIFLSRSLRLHP